MRDTSAVPIVSPTERWRNDMFWELRVLWTSAEIVGTALVAHMKLLIRWIITSLSLFAAAAVVPGIRVEQDGWTVFAAMAVILGLVNAVIRPLLKILSCPLILLTFGLFILVINAFTLMLAASIAVGWFHVGFHVDGFVPAFLGSLIVSIVSMLLTALVREERAQA